MRTIYLDNNATTAVAPEVRDAILPYLSELYGNPSSMHTFGGQVAEAMENAKQSVVSLLGASPDEILFTLVLLGESAMVVRPALPRRLHRHS